ncbi:pentapeptide repeat-containing protein [Nocardia brevicatena]|uniref:pentapeptide repeat-containing protein n=1 Tax=Nocardia brevicatena TaxID=37327 RepID=UPI000A002891
MPADADLARAAFTSADLSAADLTGAHLAGAVLPWARFGHANLTGADFTGATSPTSGPAPAHGGPPVSHPRPETTGTTTSAITACPQASTPVSALPNEVNTHTERLSPRRRRRYSCAQGGRLVGRDCRLLRRDAHRTRALVPKYG